MTIKKRAALYSLIVGIVMFISKIGAYFLTNSAAVLSDALESIVHIIATTFVFYSMMLTAKPPDETHPYGYGKIEFFSAGLEGVLIIIASFTIIYFAVRDLIFGSKISSLDIGAVIIFS